MEAILKLWLAATAGGVLSLAGVITGELRGAGLSQARNQEVGVKKQPHSNTGSSSASASHVLQGRKQMKVEV